jgi:hypothetical protein
MDSGEHGPAVLSAVALLEAGTRGDRAARLSLLADGDDARRTALGLECVCNSLIGNVAALTGCGPDRVLAVWAGFLRDHYLTREA